MKIHLMTDKWIAAACRLTQHTIYLFNLGHFIFI